MFVLPNLQILTQTYFKGLLQCVPYHLTADVVSQADSLDDNLADLFNWQSDCSAGGQNLREVISGLADLIGVPEHVAKIATLPEYLHNLSFLSLCCSVNSSFVISFPQSIHYAMIRVKLHHNTVKHKTVILQPFLCSPFHNGYTFDPLTL